VLWGRKDMNADLLGETEKKNKDRPSRGRRRESTIALRVDGGNPREGIIGGKKKSVWWI